MCCGPVRSVVAVRDDLRRCWHSLCVSARGDTNTLWHSAHTSANASGDAGDAGDRPQEQRMSQELTRPDQSIARTWAHTLAPAP